MTLTVQPNFTVQPELTAQPEIDMLAAFGSAIMSTSETGNSETGVAFLKAGWDGPPIHVHVEQDETFRVLQGTLEVYKQNKWIQVSEGEEIFIPKNTPHSFRSRDTADCYYEYVITPKGGFTDMLRTFQRLSQEDKIRSNKDLRSLMYMAMVFKQYEHEVRSTTPPHFVMTALAGVGKLAGFKL
ncbi:MAG: cupin domain-containing protein [Chloroflexota bacterium]